MKDIVIRKVENMVGYDYIVYPTSYINPLLNKKLLSSKLSESIHENSKILFDLLLCNGNCFNRFCKGTFDGTKIKSLEFANIDDESTIKFIEQYYAENRKTLSNGVLVRSEYMMHC